MAAGQKVVVRLYDPAPAQGSLTDWLLQQLASNSFPPGVRNQCQPKMLNADEASCLVQPGDGDYYYNAVLTASGEHRLVVMEYAPDTSSAISHLPAIRSILKAAKAGEGRVSDAQPTPASVVPEAAATLPAATAAIPAAPASSLPVEGIYLHRENTFGIGGAMTFTFQPYLFFKDGTFTTDIAIYPNSSSQIAAWRSRRPKEWGRWKKSSASIDVQWDYPGSKPTHWKEWHVAERGKPGTSLAGPYRAIGGGGNTSIGGDSIVAGWSDLNFLPNGTFISDGGMMASAGGNSGNGSVVAKSTKAQRVVRYSIDGFTIHLDYGDGKNVSQWFYLYPGGDSVFGMGNKVYSLRKK